MMPKDDVCPGMTDCQWPTCFREVPVDGPPPERLLQAVWFHQRLHRDALRLTDGRPVRVLHPGFWNREAGPDFRRAILQWEDGSTTQGDVEVDLHSSGWKTHGHAGNPEFAGVILHVVWSAAPRCPGPTLELPPFLEVPVEELLRWHGSAEAGRWPPALVGQCRAPLQGLPPGQQEELLQQAASARLRIKAARLTTRARMVGWNAALWEFLFRALGYKQNPWPMQRVGELLPQLLTPPLEADRLLSRLLGVAGLLPTMLPVRRTPGRDYACRLWDLWIEDHSRFEASVLPRSLWHLHHLRPANQPQRRLALAARWIEAGGLPQRMREWAASLHGIEGERALVAAFVDALAIPHDPFWESHWTLRTPAGPGARPLLGIARATDLAINAVLPWLWALAGSGEGTCAPGWSAAAMERAYFLWPRAQDNAVLRLARERLLGGDPRGCSVRTAARQQGLLQIVSDFCEHSDAACRQCPFSQLVAEYGG
jgi:hypothetical protein